MKLTIFRAFIIFAGSVGLISYTTAGPGGSVQPAQLDSDQGTVVPTVTRVPGVSPGFSARDSVASQSTAGTQSTATNGSSNSQGNSSNSSSTSQNPSANSSSNGFLNQNTTAASNFVGRGQEKVVEISDKDLAAEAAGNSEKSEVTKKFEPSILNAGIDEIANSKASSKVPDFAPINPATGATIPPRRASSAPPISPIPHATVPSQVPAVPGISPIPSAAVSPLPKD